MTGQGQLRDLVEEEGGTGGTGLVAQERVPRGLAVELGVRHPRALESDERTLGPAALGMDGPRQDLLARPGLTEREDIGVGRCNDESRPATCPFPPQPPTGDGGGKERPPRPLRRGARCIPEK